MVASVAFYYLDSNAEDKGRLCVVDTNECLRKVFDWYTLVCCLRHVLLHERGEAARSEADQPA